MTTPDLGSEPLAQVSVHRDGDRWTLVFVRTFRHPRERVWAALTDPAQLREWAPFVPDRALTSPGPATLRMEDGGTVDDLPGEVLRVEPPSLLEHTWDDDLLRWELAEAGDGTTTLTLRHAMHDRDFLSRTSAGWHLCLAVAERLLDGEPFGRVTGEDAKQHGWDRLEQAYADAIGAGADAR